MRNQGRLPREGDRDSLSFEDTTYRMKDVVKSPASRQRELLVEGVDTPYSQKETQGTAYSKHVVNREAQLDCIYLGLPCTAIRTPLRERELVQHCLAAPTPSERTQNQIGVWCIEICYTTTGATRQVQQCVLRFKNQSCTTKIHIHCT